MHRPQPTHGGGAPWGPPAPHAYYPSGDHHAPDHHHQQPPSYSPPRYGQNHTQQFTQPHHPPAAIHGRAQPPRDAFNVRLKDEQRRRQHEYSQALAEQVRQREQQKVQEKEARRRDDAAFDAQHGAAPTAGAAAGKDRGLFDGLGQNNNAGQRTNFGRGRREPAHPPAPPPPHAAMAPSPAAYYVPAVPIDMQPQAGWSGHAEALGLVEPQHYNPYGEPGHGQPHDGPWSGPPHQHPPLPPLQNQQQQLQPQQAPSVVGGRRVRTDLHDGGAGGLHDDPQKQLRLQQQLDMQETLRRQIEDKQRQKLEEKRKREEDERREMEKFEQEKRRQHEDQERLKDEKRRKAQAEEAHFRAQQQQLAAANAAAQEQRHQHQRHHHSPMKASAAVVHNEPSPPRNRQLPASVQPAAVSGSKNPFANSRAHLFADPPSPQQQPHHHHQYQQQPQAQHVASPGQQLMGSLRDHQGVAHGPAVHQRSARDHHAGSVDTQFLREQYEQVRAELERQRQLVEQLHAQMQIQQQQQHRSPREGTPRALPTVSDLERLRQELRDELEQRETQHRQELEALRRQQQQQQQRQSHVNQTEPVPALDPRPKYPQRSPARHEAAARRGPGRRHDAFVQDALSDNEEDPDPRGSLDSSTAWHGHNRGNQRLSPSASQQQQRQSGILDHSLSAASLQCESKLVFFDGRIQHHQHEQAASRPGGHGDPARSLRKSRIREHAPEVDEGPQELDDSVDALIHQVPVSSSTSKPTPSTLRPPDNQQETPAYSSSLVVRDRTYSEDDDDNDALGFFVKRFDRHELAPERYRSSASLQLRSSFAESIEHRESHGAFAILQDVDDDVSDDEHAETDSLDGATLEAIFQRNVRRHEILSGFEAQRQRRAPQPTHWEELQRKLRSVPDEVATRTTAARAKAQAEPSLVASSRWMPSNGLP